MKKVFFSTLLLCVAAIAANAQTDYQHTPNGVLYKNFTNLPGDKLKVNDVISINVIQKTDKDSVLASSYTSGQPVKVPIKAPESIDDFAGSNLMYIFATATVKDSLLVKVPTDTLFKGRDEARPPFFPKGSYLDFVIKIVRTESMNDAIAERNADMAKVKDAELASANKYIADNKLIVKTTPSGLRYVITKPSMKPKPQKGDTVSVNYVGKLVNGQVFDTSIQSAAEAAHMYQQGRPYEPFKFPIGVQAVIPGWDEGLSLMNEGSKAIFIVPSSLAYGEHANGNIPPFSTLVFDVELVSVKRVPHTPAPTAPKKTVLRKHHAGIKKAN